MPGDSIRILSDVHYGDRASRVRHLDQLRPLLQGVSRVVFNGDTLDTRPGPLPEHTASCRQAVETLVRSVEPEVTFLTGNHDPDFSDLHALELVRGSVFVVHGDVLFDDIVPWGRDAAEIRQRIAAELGHRGIREVARLPLEERLAVWRRVAAAIPQRHQSERSLLKYAVRFAIDTVWPPTRFTRILGSWRQEPRLAAALAATHRPHARFVILGHTHRPLIRRIPGGPIIINTGSYTAPFGGYAVDLTPGVLRAHRVVQRDGEFRRGPVVAEFALPG